jgi:polyhydroxyalkanoate synthase subunit PhaE
MAETPKTGNPFFDTWMEASRRFLEPSGGQGDPTAAMAGGAEMSEAVARAEETWKLCQRQAGDWVKASSHWLQGRKSEAAEGIADETLKRMLDPTRFLYAGTDEINQAIQRLVEGPEFADIGTIERQMLKATREWMALRGASAAYRAVTASAWSRAFQSFTQEVAKEPKLMQAGFRPVLDRWLAVANDELIRTQRTEGFLNAQRELLAAGVDYRLKERELVEVWCETHSMPTRTEVDDLHRTVHALRTQVRALTARLAAAEAKPAAETPEPAPEKPAPEKPAVRRRTAAPRRRTGKTSRGAER